MELFRLLQIVKRQQHQTVMRWDLKSKGDSVRSARKMKMMKTKL